MTTPNDKETRTLRPTSSIQPEPWHLLVVDGEQAFRFPLPSSGVVHVGRSEHADLTITDPTASRDHARIVLGSESITVTDLDSHNGTQVNGERLEATRFLVAGDMISIGSTVLVVYIPSPIQRIPVLDELPVVRRRLGEEVERAVNYGRSVCILACRIDGDPSRVALARILEHRLRSLDRASRDGKRWLIVLLPESTQSEAMTLMQPLVADLGRVCGPVRAGLSCCPSDGSDEDLLIAVARQAANMAEDGTVKSVADAVVEHVLADTSVIVAEPAMNRVYELLRRLATSDLAVLIHGETGSGKENAARAVHSWSKRKDGPFVAVNCAAIQNNLIESELFGHEKGAFTSASSTKVGLLERANGGTLFLDEIGELSQEAQAKLLRVLETQRITRLGDVRERAIDVRIVAATHRDLEAEVAATHFRQDLFFRISTAMVRVPPLRERKIEIPILARRFLRNACQHHDIAQSVLSDNVVGFLLDYTWPGNVRELKNAIEYAAVTADGPTIRLSDLPDRLTRCSEGPSSRDDSTASNPSDEPGAQTFKPLAAEIEELEKIRIEQAMKAAGAVKSRAARLLDMPLRTFQNKLKRYSLWEST